MRDVAVSAVKLEELSIIIPFRQSADRPEALWRLWHQIRYLKKACPQAQLVVSDQSSCVPISAIATFERSIRHVWNPQRVYSPASCKNAGARKADGKKLLFLDIDILPTHRMFTTLAEQFEASAFKMLWFPVHFVNRDAPTFRQFINTPKLMEADLSEVLEQVGYATGIQAFSADFFWQLGGYDENFEGYGCEDLDMIHRSSLAMEWLKPDEIDEEYFCDHRTNIREEYRGFRKKFAEIIESKINTESKYCLHLWHDRRAKRTYRRMRRANDSLLYAKLKDITP